MPLLPGRFAKTVTPRRVRAALGEEFEALEALREKLAAEPELVILFGACDQRRAHSRSLVAFGDSLGIPVKYVCLVDYSNSRGASDMGVLPDLLPGYHSCQRCGIEPGLNYDQMLDATDLDVVLDRGRKSACPAQIVRNSQSAFVVVQDTVPHRNSDAAPMSFCPAASAYEKNGTVTNVTGEVQKLSRGAKTMGAKSDLEIIGLLAKEMREDLGSSQAEACSRRSRASVRGYDVPFADHRNRRRCGHHSAQWATSRFNPPPN